MEKKFIKTTDTDTANKLTAYGFKLVAHIGNIYTFLNEASKLNFDAIDKKMIVYDDKLSL
jgi:hypothetical protein